MKLATLCYVKSNGKTLMLQRNSRPEDVHYGKWNGLGGKLLPDEAPEECAIREIKEESGLLIRDPEFKGFITFPHFAKGETWHVWVYVATHFSGTLLSHSLEGELHWIDDKELLSLNLWEGDHIFIPWLNEDKIFSAKFVYENGKLQSHSVRWH